MWTFRGERQLHFLLTRLQWSEYVGEQARLTDLLRMVFADAVAVIVLDLYFGFGQRLEEYILLVDVRTPTDGCGGTQVVKRACDARLRVECEAWANTREAQFGGDEVLMRQGPAYHPHYNHRLIAICYQDAANHIGLGRQVSLEEAFVDCVRFGTPSVESIRQVFDTLFRSLGRELYAGTSARGALTPRLELNPDNAHGGRRRSLNEEFETRPGERPPATFTRWATGRPAAVAEAASAALGGIQEEFFINPIPFFRNLARYLGRSNSRFAIRLSRGPATATCTGGTCWSGWSGTTRSAPPCTTTN